MTKIPRFYTKIVEASGLHHLKILKPEQKQNIATRIQELREPPPLGRTPQFPEKFLEEFLEDSQWHGRENAARLEGDEVEGSSGDLLGRDENGVLGEAGFGGAGDGGGIAGSGSFGEDAFGGLGGEKL